MFNRLFKRATPQVEEIASFQHKDSLTLDWDDDCEGWTTPVPVLGNEARIFIGPRADSEPPQAASCELVVQALARVAALNEAALAYLIEESGAFARATYKHSLSSSSFTATGIELFEHEGRPGEYSLTYDPVFDPGAIWRVRFRQHRPVSWGFDD